MNLYRVFPQPPAAFSMADTDGISEVRSAYSPVGTDSVRAIMVTSPLGETLDSAGSSTALSLGADRRLLGIVREDADAVIVGASTLRAEPVPLPRTTPLVVLTRSGDLHGHQLVSRGAEGERLVVATPRRNADRVRDALEGFTVELLDIGDDISAEALVGNIRSHLGADHLLVEGGRTTWEYLAPLTTELLIATAAPPLNSRQGIPPWWPVPERPWDMASLFTDDARMLYYRHVIPEGGAPSPAR